MRESTLCYVADWQAETRKAAERYGLDPNIFFRQIRQESGFDPNARSGAGALGIAQIMPATAKGWGVDPLDPRAALDAAAKNMAAYVNQFGSYRNALVAYNAGPGRVGKPLYAETAHYIDTILHGRDPGKVAPRPAAPSSPSTTTSDAGGAGFSFASSVPTLQPGQGGDYTSLLAGMLGGKQQQAAPMSSALPVPQFTSGLAQPHGFRPIESSGPPRQQAASADLSLLEGLRGSGTGVEPGQVTATATGAVAEAPRSVMQNVDLARRGTGAEAALEWAKSKVGFKEATGNNDGGLAGWLNERFGFQNAAWCAMFTSVAVTKGGAPRTARTASVAEVRRQASEGGGGYRRGFVDPGHAKSGDLILFGNDHIGMVDHVAGGKVFYVGGNQSNGVTMASTAVGDGDIVRPKYGARRR